MKKIAVVLSGCGFLDGTEITEAVSALIAITEMGARYTCFAPQVDFEAKAHDHSTKNTETRNALREAARIARGKIHDLRELKESDFDAIVFPGGNGAAKTLSTFATEGAKAKVLPEVKKIIQDFHRASKPIGALCIAPAVVAKVLGSENVTLTIGNDPGTAAEIGKTGAHHENCQVTDYISDRDHKVLTTPAYMFDDATPFEVFTGIRKMIRELVEMA